MANVDIKIFLDADLKKKYQRLCLEEDTKMSADLRAYIERRCNAGSKKEVTAVLDEASDLNNCNQSVELFNFLSASQKPTNPQIVKAAARFGVDTGGLMQMCDRLFEKERCANGCD